MNQQACALCNFYVKQHFWRHNKWYSMLSIAVNMKAYESNNAHHHNQYYLLNICNQNTINLFNLFYFMFMGVLPVCMSVHLMSAR